MQIVSLVSSRTFAQQVWAPRSCFRLPMRLAGAHHLLVRPSALLRESPFASGFQAKPQGKGFPHFLFCLMYLCLAPSRISELALTRRKQASTCLRPTRQKNFFALAEYPNEYREHHAGFEHPFHSAFPRQPDPIPAGKPETEEYVGEAFEKIKCVMIFMPKRMLFTKEPAQPCLNTLVAVAQKLKVFLDKSSPFHTFLLQYRLDRRTEMKTAMR